MDKWLRVGWMVALITLLVVVACCADDAKLFPVSGKVLAPDGSPAVGATVEARDRWTGSDKSPFATVKTGDDGVFTMQLPAGEYCVCALLGDLVHIDLAESVEVAKDGAVAESIELKLSKGCRVDGTIVDTSTGQPVEGATIHTREGDRAVSDASGKWNMVVARHNQTLIAMKDGYYWPIMDCSCSQDTTTVKVETKPGGTIKGRIVDEQGKPVAGARVTYGEFNYFHDQSVNSDADGRFVLAGQDLDAKALVSASANGYEYLNDQSIIFEPGKREAAVKLTIKKRKVRTVSGRVTNPDGSPIEHAKVAYGYGDNYSDYAYVWTDKDGNYTLKNAAARKCVVVATHKGLAPSYKPIESDIDAHFDFVLKPGHTVEGRVENEEGEPLPDAGFGAYMKIEGCDSPDRLYGMSYTVADKNGHFKLSSLPEGKIYVYVDHEGYESINYEPLNVDRKDYTLVLRKRVAGCIRGTVKRESDGKPITEFNVRLGFSRAGGQSSGLALGLTEHGVSFQNAEGKFTIDGLKPKETYQVIVTAPGYALGTADPVMVKPTSEENYTDTVIKLHPGKSFEGSITAADTGAPLGGAIVSAYNLSGFDGSFYWDVSHASAQTVSARADANGKIRIDSMPFAYGMVMIEKPGYARTMVKGVSFTRPLQVKLEKGATVTGSIADEKGNVSKDDWVSVMTVDLSLSFRAELKPDGSFTVADIPSGEYRVIQYRDNHGIRHDRFAIKPGETHIVDWNSKGPVIVKGRVTQNGKPVSKAEVISNCQNGGEWTGTVETLADGSYEFTLPSPEAYFVCCQQGEWSDPNRTYAARTLKLSTGANVVDFKLPYGSISGRLVDKLTGRPLADTAVRLCIHETWEQNRGRAGLSFSEVNGRWWTEKECKTDKDGVFRAKNLRAGEWMICSDPGGIPAAVVRLADGEAKSGVIAKAPPTGSAQVTIKGSRDRPKGVYLVCVDQYGNEYYPKSDNSSLTVSFQDLPIGKMRVVREGYSYLPICVPFEVRQGATSKVSVRLTEGPRIVFRTTQDADVMDKVSVGFRITSTDGKPVLSGMYGPVWGDVLTGLPSKNEPAFVTVKPGTYVVKAGAVRGDGRNYGDDPPLTGFSGKVTVKAGKDTIIDLPLAR